MPRFRNREEYEQWKAQYQQTATRDELSSEGSDSTEIGSSVPLSSTSPIHRKAVAVASGVGVLLMSLLIIWLLRGPTSEQKAQLKQAHEALRQTWATIPDPHRDPAYLQEIEEAARKIPSPERRIAFLKEQSGLLAKLARTAREAEFYTGLLKPILEKADAYRMNIKEEYIPKCTRPGVGAPESEVSRYWWECVNTDTRGGPRWERRQTTSQDASGTTSHVYLHHPYNDSEVWFIRNGVVVETTSHR